MGTLTLLGFSWETLDVQSIRCSSAPTAWERSIRLF
jgi:hypothetical protein